MKIRVDRQALDAAEAAFAQGDLHEAQSRFTQLIRQSPHDLDAWNGLAVLFHHIGRPQEALDRIEQCRMIDPFYPDLAVNRIRLLIELGRIDEARQHLEEVLSAHPEHEGIRELASGIGMSVEKTPRHIQLILGPPARDSLRANPNVWFYSYDTPTPDPRTLYEQDYLDARLFAISGRHWAEFGAFWVMYHHNPLGLRDEDRISFLSSRKFEWSTQLPLKDWFGYAKTIGAVLHDRRVLSVVPYPDRELTRIDRTSFYHPGHFHTETAIQFAKEHGLRDVFHNYPPVWRNYFTFTWGGFKKFFEWCHQHLFLALFEADGTPKEELLRSLSSPETGYENYRVFGLVFEFFLHRYFWSNNAEQLLLDRWGKIYRLSYKNEALDPHIQFVMTLAAQKWEREWITIPLAETLEILGAGDNQKTVAIVGLNPITHVLLAHTGIVDLNIIGIFDQRSDAEECFGYPVRRLNELTTSSADIVILTEEMPGISEFSCVYRIFESVVRVAETPKI